MGIVEGDYQRDGYQWIWIQIGTFVVVVVVAAVEVVFVWVVDWNPYQCGRGC